MYQLTQLCEYFWGISDCFRPTCPLRSKHLEWLHGRLTTIGLPGTGPAPEFGRHGRGSVAGMRTALAAVGVPGLSRALASGYQGPPELTVTRALTEWTLDPWMLALILLLGGSYLAGVRRARTSRDNKDNSLWPVARQIWFCGLGLGFLVIATMSWVGVYQPILFWVRAVQTVLLVLVVPLFLALGRPVLAWRH
jgi:hypothetical protein